MKLIKIKEVMNVTTLSRATIYKYMASGRFPKSVSLGGRAVAWVKDWVAQRVSERDEETVKS
ncbi:helix-turn-helix transcriptional regulator [Aliidiomarina maris]|uniref:Transcriptional regulator n=1 Tax=Aliidiomarina maris TaxID=531312 RepID=A0A327X6R8_9GAMM|nr:AlpA family phage regulatory protein [Aliidiomarina maris]RAK01583.1 AlpA family transcriptional regulator [Aliidiomarina maris]RUO28413.1 transcriptional regulator [Aliidiomarina maris]